MVKTISYRQNPIGLFKMQTNFYFISLFTFCFALTGCAKDTIQWHSLGETKSIGVSGIATIDKEHFLVVHDGKKTEHPRLGVVTWQEGKEPALAQLDWCDKTTLPIDLEAITAIPNHEHDYLVLESKGSVSRIQLQGINNCKTTAHITLPTATAQSNMEALALHCFGADCILIWAERGDDKQAAKLSWAKFDSDKNTIASTQVKTFEFTASYPGLNRRSISDIAIDKQGAMWVSSASDPGDEGPFQSAIYRLGAFSMNNSEINWIPSSNNTQPVAKYETDNIKIEGISFIQDDLIMGTDDENKGSKIMIKQFSIK